MSVYSKQSNSITFMSDYFYGINDSNKAGTYTNKSGYKFVCVPVMPDCNIIITTICPNNYGDFDISGQVDFEDYRLFSDHYLKTIKDPNYDSMYDYDSNGSIDLMDFYSFFAHWLNGKSKADFNKDGIANLKDYSAIMANLRTTNALYDLNTDGIVDFKDFKIFTDNYLKGR
jgi:hypothetical protein